MGIKELLGEARGEEPKPNHWLQELIDAERNRPLETVDFDVQIGAVLAAITLTEVRGYEWAEISATPPRPGNTEDARLGCHTDRLLAAYPVDRITVDGEHPAVEDWAALLDVIGAPSRADIVAALWWMHWGLPLERKANAKKHERGAD